MRAEDGAGGVANVDMGDAAGTLAAAIGKKSPLQLYIRAFNNKIVPISLTVVSTVLGLIPFLMDGPDEVFWFAFAIGTMSGLLFSLLALVFVMPVWVRMR